MGSKKLIDREQNKKSPFSTHDIIWVNYKIVSQLFQLILLSFSYLKIARHNLVFSFF